MSMLLPFVVFSKILGTVSPSKFPLAMKLTIDPLSFIDAVVRVIRCTLSLWYKGLHVEIAFIFAAIFVLEKGFHGWVVVEVCHKGLGGIFFVVDGEGASCRMGITAYCALVGIQVVITGKLSLSFNSPLVKFSIIIHLVSDIVQYSIAVRHPIKAALIKQLSWSVQNSLSLWGSVLILISQVVFIQFPMFLQRFIGNELLIAYIQ